MQYSSIGEPSILNATVMHKRIKPRVNAFSYKVYYVALPLHILEETPEILPLHYGLKYNRFGLHAIYQQDHGYRDQRTWREWVNDKLIAFNQPLWQDITLVTMPRVFGYVFNPVSFWLCRDHEKNLKVVICEVNNTFGETHSYLCLPESTDANIDIHTLMSAEKIFHVSPFLPRQGKYDFRFSLSGNQCDIHIDYCDIEETQNEDTSSTLNLDDLNSHDSQKQSQKHTQNTSRYKKVLLTSLKGEFIPLTPALLKQAFWRCPLVTLKAITLIHFQALKIVLKKIAYIKKPVQLAVNHSKTNDQK